ncbi:hypothetical protein M3Y97_00145800 [Aphelenchoides bicaudatus]|nr:hypothetical protein M3Y97_00145800 [Aphelenchoides bicaudatus]
MDQTEMNSVLNQTQATVENIEKHVRGLTNYHASIEALYNQLKHTAQFLAEIVHSLGLDDEQIKLIIQKINQLQLSIQETGEISTKLANDTQQIVAELSAVSFRIEQTIRTTFIEPSSFVESSRINNNKVLDEVAAKNQLIADNNKKFAEKENELLSQIKELQKQVESTRLEKENFEFQKLLAARNNELESRENVIEGLRVEAEKQKLPAGLEEEISNQLQTIYNTMTDVTNRMNKN